MICSKCGNEAPEGAAFCPKCGTPLTEQPTESAAEENAVPKEAVPEPEEEEKPKEEKSEPEEEKPEADEKTAEIEEEALEPAAEEEQEEKEVSEPEKEEKTEDEAKVSEPKANIVEQGKNALLKLSKNVKIVIAAGAVFLVVLMILLFSGSKGRYTFAEPGSGYYILENDTLYNLEGDIKQLEEQWYSVYYSADASLTVLLDSEDTLYVVGKKGLTKVADDVGAVQVSFFGDTIAYVSDIDDSVGSLYLYQVSKRKSTLIDREAYAGNLVLSPDGKSVAYIGNCDFTEGVFGFGTVVEGDLYVSRNGKKGEKLYSDSIPLALTDGGKHVYYIKNNEKLYLDEERISSNVDLAFYFNEDNTELIYGRDGNTYYYTMKRADSVKLKGSVCNGWIVPSGVAVAEQRLEAYHWVYSYGISSFNEGVINMGELYYMSDDGNSVEKIGKVRSCKLSEDGKSLLICETDGDLCYIKNIHKSLETKQLGDHLEASSFVASSDLKKIYYMSDGEIFYLNGSKGVRVADEADFYAYSDKYGAVYFICDEELFYATTKSKSKEKIMGESVKNLVKVGPEILFVFEDENKGGIRSIYKISGKKKVEILMTEKD